MKIGDIVKYKRGERIYTITNINNTGFVILDGEYLENPNKLIKLNKYSKGEFIKYYNCSKQLYGVISEVHKHRSGKISYTINIPGGIDKIDQEVLLKNIIKDENRLQEQDSAERRFSNSGVSEQLCCRDRICFELGYRGNKYCFNQSSEQIKRSYANLPLGHQEIFGCQTRSGRISEIPELAPRSEDSTGDEITEWDPFWFDGI